MNRSTLSVVCVLSLALLGGCASDNQTQTVSGSQETAMPAPPPPPPPEPPPVQEMAPQAAAPPEDPLAWAADLNEVHFEFDKSNVRGKKDRTTLDALAQKLKEDGKRKVVVEGHCDNRGTANYNMMLGERRAKAVKHYLVKAGVPGSQVEVVSFGKERPLCREMNEECWQNNRRAHFTAQ